jgi:hypothetical protein
MIRTAVAVSMGLWAWREAGSLCYSHGLSLGMLTMLCFGRSMDEWLRDSETQRVLGKLRENLDNLEIDEVSGQ